MDLVLGCVAQSLMFDRSQAILQNVSYYVDVFNEDPLANLHWDHKINDTAPMSAGIFKACNSKLIVEHVTTDGQFERTEQAQYGGTVSFIQE